MFTRPDLNGWLVDFLGEHVDGLLHEAGFERRKGARSARRRTDYGSQKIEFFVLCRPRYAPDKAHLAVNINLHMPELMNLTRKMFGANWSGGVGDPSLACGVAVDTLRAAPASMWLFQNRAALNDLAANVRQSLASEMLPFLNASSGIASFVNGPARDRARVQVVAATYVHLGQQDKAVDYLRARIDNETGVSLALLTPQAHDGQRRRYADALTHLQRYLASNRESANSPTLDQPRM